MPIKFTANIFYNVIRYRILSHITSGKRKKKYREKYHAIKNFINTFDIKKYYILGLPVLGIKNCHTYKCHELLGIPVVIQIFHENTYACRIFGVNVYKKKVKPQGCIPPVIHMPNELATIAITTTEQEGQQGTFSETAPMQKNVSPTTTKEKIIATLNFMEQIRREA